MGGFKVRPDRRTPIGVSVAISAFVTIPGVTPNKARPIASVRLHLTVALVAPRSGFASAQRGKFVPAYTLEHAATRAQFLASRDRIVFPFAGAARSNLLLVVLFHRPRPPPGARASRTVKLSLFDRRPFRKRVNIALTASTAMQRHIANPFLDPKADTQPAIVLPYHSFFANRHGKNARMLHRNIVLISCTVCACRGNHKD